jgi:A/G-specific adenine glycosylase
MNVAGGSEHAVCDDQSEVAVDPHASFSSRIVRWQRQHGRHDLPWQNTRDPYRIWLSEVMLQQTQVGAVIPYYQRFLARFPDVMSLAASDEDEVLTLWSGLGYYARARNLHRAARTIAQQHRGIFPTDHATVCSLPGIGRSTASAVCVFAYGARHAILDGNVKRVLARHFSIDGYPGERPIESQLWALSESLLPTAALEAYTQGLMDLGASVCVRRRPRCGLCPVSQTCVALREQRTDELPSPRPSKPLPERSTTMAILVSQGEVLLEKRPAPGIWGGLWCFPEMEAGRLSEECMSRFSLAVQNVERLAALDHGFTHFRLRIQPMLVRVARNPGVQEPGRLWLSIDDARGAAIPVPVKKILGALARGSL